MYATHRHDLFYITVKYHRNILYGFQVIERTRKRWPDTRLIAISPEPFSRGIKKLENVFMKHYAPNHMPDPKGEWTLKENNSELHHGIYSKVNQFIYTLVCNYMPNIRILAKAVLQIFRSQGCSYIKCLCPENESNSTESLRNVLKS